MDLLYLCVILKRAEQAQLHWQLDFKLHYILKSFIQLITLAMSMRNMKKVYDNEPFMGKYCCG